MEQMDKRQVLRRLSMAGCIGLMRTVLQDDAEGKSRQYLRTVTPCQGTTCSALCLRTWARETIWEAKVITVFPGNHQAGLPSHQGSVLLLAPSTALCDLWLTAAPSPRSAPARSVL